MSAPQVSSQTQLKDISFSLDSSISTAIFKAFFVSIFQIMLTVKLKVVVCKF